MKTTSLPLLALALALTTAASAKVTEKFAQTYPLDAQGSIRLENINGSVEIIAWDKAEVSLEAEKVAKNEEGLKRMNLKISSTPQRLTIKTEYEKLWKFWDNMNAEVHYKLMVPAGAALDKISVINSSVQVTDIKGSVKVEAVNGSIDAKGLAGPGEFETVNGPIKVAYASLAARPEISLDTVNGSSTLTLPADAAFELDADTVNGNIRCDFPITLEKSGRHELNGSVNGGGAKVEMESVNGGLSVERAK